MSCRGSSLAMSDQTQQRLQSMLKWSLGLAGDDNQTSQPTEITDEVVKKKAVSKPLPEPRPLL